MIPDLLYVFEPLDPVYTSLMGFSQVSHLFLVVIIYFVKFQRIKKKYYKHLIYIVEMNVCSLTWRHSAIDIFQTELDSHNRRQLSEESKLKVLLSLCTCKFQTIQAFGKAAATRITSSHTLYNLHEEVKSKLIKGHLNLVFLLLRLLKLSVKGKSNINESFYSNLWLFLNRLSEDRF